MGRGIQSLHRQISRRANLGLRGEAMIYSCPFCGTMFEMGSDHGVEPCSPCYRAGHRVGIVGNRFVPDRATSSPYDLSPHPQKEYPSE